MEKKQLPITAPMSEMEVPSYTPAANSPYAIMTLARSDRIRLLSFPQGIIDAVRDTIQASWPRGIQDQREFNGAQEFKLCGWSWTTGFEDTTHAARLMSRILAMLHSHGWVLTLTTDISKRVDTKDSLIFRHQQAPLESYDWITIAFHGSDQIHVIDGPPDLTQALADGLSLVTRTHKPHKMQDLYEIRVCGSPWNGVSDDPMQWCKLELKLMELLESNGFRVYGSVNQKSNSAGNEAATWHCCRRGGWVPGAPVHN